MTSARANELPLHMHLWGKADPARAAVGPAWHPLVAHMLEVAACAEAILRARPGRLRSLAAAMGLTPDEALPWLLLFVTLHDLGKATPAFQRKVPDAVTRLDALGFDFPDSDEPHGEMGASLLPDVFAGLGVPPPLATLAALAVAAHHGAFASATKRCDLLEGGRKHRGKASAWSAARAEIIRDIASVLAVRTVPRAPSSDGVAHAFAADLAGLTTAADWIGSNADIFTYVEPTADLTALMARARGLARQSTNEVGMREAPRAASRSFHALFGKPAWPLHAAMESVLPSLMPGSLVIVEAAMGEGKTEAALLVFDTLAARGADGLYFALPTQATANQILGRVERYLAKSFGGTHGLHLVHGGAALSDHYDDLKMRALALRSIDGIASTDAVAVADAWFTRSKRALLAPLGVGTIDQALLGVLRAKHHFLRLHGLAGKVVVFDEVHAYDVFTSKLLARLCEWLRELGATVVLLSATLSSPQRAALLAAYGARAEGASSYPRITVADRHGARTVAFDARRDPVELTLRWKPEDEMIADVIQALGDGGCAAWIVNTVARAQRVYAELRERQRRGELAPDLALGLLHARLPHSERLRREKDAERSFGPPNDITRRPGRALLIGTQVLEQSLDLDFDLMVTELSPVDLVLQRAGRLHRHDGRVRPTRMARPELWITIPEGADASRGPTFGASAFVYDEATLLRSYLALRSRASLALPTDIEPLVEAVYAPSSVEAGRDPELTTRLSELDAERQAEMSGERYLAERKALPSPTNEAPFDDFSCFFDDEDPAVHEELRAVTRLGQPSVSVVPVASLADHRLTLARDPSVSFDPDDAALPFAVAKQLARGGLTVSHRRVVKELLADAEAHPQAFRRSGVLRHYRLLRLDSLGATEVGGVALRLDDELGLVVGRLLDPTDDA